MDNFKDAWKTLSKSNFGNNYSVEELNKIVRQKSKSEISRIKRKIIIEWSLSLVLSILFVGFVHYSAPTKTIYALIFIALIFTVSLIPYINLIKKGDISQNDLKRYLEDFVFRFEKLVSQYIRMIVYLIPLVVCGAYFLGFYIGNTFNGTSFFINTKHAIISVAVIAAFIALGCFLLKRYFKWIYGKNIYRIKECLNELEDKKE
jgi:cation transport ATPase